jgi:hypothetical protein
MARHQCTFCVDFAGSAIIQELVSLSRTLRQIAIVNLEALDDLKKHGQIKSTSMAGDLAILKFAEQPHAALINVVAPRRGSCS